MPKSPLSASLPVLLCLAALLAAGCRSGGASTEPVYVDDGMLITDSVLTLDEFNFTTAACSKVFPGGSVNVDTVPSNAVAHIRIIATACYALRVSVVSSDSDTVRAFATRFGIFNRSDAEKNRGVVGFVAWNGEDDKGAQVPRGEYLWRMEFDFGAGRIRKLRARFEIP